MTSSPKIPGAPRLRRFVPGMAGLTATAVLALAPACAPPEETAAPPEPVEVTDAVLQAAEAVTAEKLEKDTRYLASDDLAGRGPASEGDALARVYIAQRLRDAGFAPGAANGGWEQPFPIVSVHARAPEAWSFESGAERVAFAWWDDYIAFSGVQEPTAKIEDAEVVFVGYGIEAPEYEWDDYKDADLEGKVLLMLNNDPDWDPELFEGDRRLYYGRWTYKYEIAAEKGAAGAIVIHTTPSAGYPYQVVQSSWTGPQFELPAEGEPRIQIGGWLTWEATERLVGLIGKDLAELEEAAHSRDFRPVPLGIRTSLELENEIDQVETANVIGVLRGSDPELAEEAVVFTAHHDHLGVGQADADGDTIYNGARDNALGVAQLLALAESFTALPEPPRRSIVMLLVGAEEQGLLGSAYYARHPTFPPGKIAGNLNFDAPSIWGPTRDLPLIGLGKSSLDEVAQRAADHQGRTITPEVDPTQGSYYRSDQFNFAKIGVPALYFGEGTDFLDADAGWSAESLQRWNLENYHQPSDEIDDTWELSGAVQDARLGFYAGWMVAQEDELPGWVPGDEFEAARREALAAVAGE